MVRKLFYMYAAGTLGALVMTLAGWGIEFMGWMDLRDSGFLFSYSLAALYPRLVWGGIWAIPYPILGLNKLSWLQAGFLLALVPTAVAWLYFFPTSGAGYLGFHRGIWVPVITLGLNLIWGWVTAFFGSGVK